MTDYDRFLDYTTYDIDLIRHERSVKGVISNGTCYIAPLIWLLSHATMFDQQGTDSLTSALNSTILIFKRNVLDCYS